MASLFGIEQRVDEVSKNVLELANIIKEDQKKTTKILRGLLAVLEAHVAVPVAEKHVCTSECNSEKEQKPRSAVEIVQLLMPGAGKMLEGGPFVFDHYEIKQSVLKSAFINFRALLYFKDGPFGEADNVIMMEGKVIEERGHHLINTYNTSTFIPVDHLAEQLEAAGWTS